MKAELEKAGITAGSGSFEQGDLNYRDDSLDAYTEFSVSYDKTSNHWMYGEKLSISFTTRGITLFATKV